MTRGSYRIEGANNEVRDVVVEVGRPEGDLVMEQGLLEADIETRARLRSKIGIGDRVEGWEVHIQFRQGRRLEAGAISRFQFGLRPGDDVCWGDPPCRVRPEALVVVVADVRDDKEPVPKLRLQFKPRRFVSRACVSCERRKDPGGVEGPGGIGAQRFLLVL